MQHRYGYCLVPHERRSRFQLFDAHDSRATSAGLVAWFSGGGSDRHPSLPSISRSSKHPAKRVAVEQVAELQIFAKHIEAFMPAESPELGGVGAALHAGGQRAALEAVAADVAFSNSCESIQNRPDGVNLPSR